MNFLAPWFLAGLAGLAIPLLVHLTQKQRKEIIQFPSLMFLRRIPYEAVRRQRLRNLLVFTLRCLAILFLALAFAQPFLAGSSKLLGIGGVGRGRDMVILLDRSYSMEYGDRWQRATAAAKKVIDEMHGDDRATVVYFAGTAWVPGVLTTKRAALRAAVDSVRPTAGETHYAAAFELAGRILGKASQPRREVVLISDYQRTGWLAHELPPLPQGTTFTQIDIGDSATANVVVADVKIRDDSSARDRVIVTASVANPSSEPVTGRPVELQLNGRAMQTKMVDLPARGAVKVDFDPLPTPAGLLRGSVRSGTDALERDNRFYFTLARAPAVAVLVVQSKVDSGSGLFLHRALAVGHRPSFRVKTVRPEELSADALHGMALVILNDVPVPDGAVGRQLVDYVKGGGGLIAVLGAKSAPSRWPALAGELLPRPAGAAIDQRTELGASLGFLDRGHAAFEVFNEARSGNFSTARFAQYWNVKAGPGDRELARFDDGRAALVERQVGAGRVLVLNSDLDGAWNDLPLQPVFLPFLHAMVKYAAGYRTERPWAVVGEVVRPSTLFGEAKKTGDSTADRATAGQDRVQYVAIAPSGAQTRFSNPEAPASLELTEQGVYTVHRTGDEGEATRLLAVNVNVAESNLTPLDSGLVAAAVSASAKAGRPSSPMAEHLPAPEQVESQQNLWWILLAVVLVLLGIETLLSNRLSRRLSGVAR